MFILMSIVTYNIYRFIGSFFTHNNHTRSNQPNQPSVMLLESSKTVHKLPLIKKDILSHDTIALTFRTPDSVDSLGLPIGKHLRISANINTDDRATPGQWNGRPDPEANVSYISRKYTPVSLQHSCENDNDHDHDKHVRLVVKVYKRGVLNTFQDGGKMSQYLNTLNLGDTLDIQGPFGMHEYIAPGTFKTNGRILEPVNHIGLIAGGTGITPMLQVINAVLNNHTDFTQLSLVFANKSEDDILMREHIDQLAKQHPEQFKVWYTIDAASNNSTWKYSLGYVNLDMLREHIPPAGPLTATLVCGPPPFVKFACQPNLEELRHENILVF